MAKKAELLKDTKLLEEIIAAANLSAIACILATFCSCARAKRCFNVEHLFCALHSLVGFVVGLVVGLQTYSNLIQIRSHMTKMIGVNIRSDIKIQQIAKRGELSRTMEPVGEDNGFCTN